MTDPTPAEQCRTAAATLRDDQAIGLPAWLHYMPREAAEPLAALLAISADASEGWHDPHALAFARAVNGSTP